MVQRSEEIFYLSFQLKATLNPYWKSVFYRTYGTTGHSSNLKYLNFFKLTIHKQAEVEKLKGCFHFLNATQSVAAPLKLT